MSSHLRSRPRSVTSRDLAEAEAAAAPPSARNAPGPAEDLDDDESACFGAADARESATGLPSGAAATATALSLAGVPSATDAAIPAPSPGSPGRSLAFGASGTRVPGALVPALGRVAPTCTEQALVEPRSPDTLTHSADHVTVNGETHSRSRKNGGLSPPIRTRRGGSCAELRARAGLPLARRFLCGTRRRAPQREQNVRDSRGSRVDVPGPRQLLAARVDGDEPRGRVASWRRPGLRGQRRRAVAAAAGPARHRPRESRVPGRGGRGRCRLRGHFMARHTSVPPRERREAGQRAHVPWHGHRWRCLRGSRGGCRPLGGLGATEQAGVFLLEVRVFRARVR